MIWFSLYVLTIVAANLAIVYIGPVPVGFGLMAPTGVYFASFALVARDFLQQAWGKAWSLVAVVLGAGLTALLSTDLAIASGTAFLLSELADFVVYTPLRRRGLTLAVVASASVGLVVDSWVFLSLAFHSLEYLPGQIVGKGWVVLLTLAVLQGYAFLRRPRQAY